VNTVLQARPRNFVSTPAVERVARRALRYLQSGYSVHLRGPAGTGKTTLALHLADLLSRPIMLLFGDDEFKTSDLIGNQSGYTRKKVVDNFIHSVVKVEDELRHNWVDSRLTMACREGFTLVYDEFNRSRPEVNNVLLSALEEKLLVLPPSGHRPEYLRVSPHFRAIFTSNPEEYAGVHGTQDALLDRLITLHMPEPDELTQQQILVQKVGIEPAAALLIVQLVRDFHAQLEDQGTCSLRPGLMIATICHEHGILCRPEEADFRDVCGDILLSRLTHNLPAATQLLWNQFKQMEVAAPVPEHPSEPLNPKDAEEIAPDGVEAQIYTYVQTTGVAKLSEIEAALSLNRFKAVDALRSLVAEGRLEKHNEAGKPAVYRLCIE
jgi:gas vesicle protein GvpN